MAQRRFDVVHLADPRFPGGTSTALASEIRAAAAAGYRQGLLALKGPVLRKPHPFHPELRELLDLGLCDLVDPEGAVDCGLLEVHHPLLLSRLPQAPLRIDAAHRLLIVHHPPRDGSGAAAFDAPAVARSTSEALGGREVLWAPVGPAVRAQLEGITDAPPLLGFDWFNILDPAPFAGPRAASSGQHLVLGRHSRPDPLKWPATREAVLKAYPDDPRIEVRVLGSGPFLDALMDGRIPKAWKVRPFVQGAAPGFLRELDLFVYFHHPHWVEAFGRTVLEALAAGCPTILPESFAPLFGGAAQIAPPERVLELALALRDDPARWHELSQAGRQLVAERFSPRVHLDRLRALIGKPAAATLPLRPPPQPRKRVLFVTSNGIGLGHLTRCLALARRLPAGCEPVFVSLSQALPLIRDLGYPCDHLPFHVQQRVDPSVWNRALRESLDRILAAWRPAVVVFDGNVPYEGFLSAVRRHPGIWLVWSRRGLWRPGSGAVGLAREPAFDAVLEPGELAGMWDEGPTAQQRDRTRLVAPVRLLDGPELLPPDLARAALDLPADGRAILLQFGSGNNFDYRAFAWRCAEILLRRPGDHVVALESPIATTHLPLPPGVLRRRLFPVARCLRAFDAAVGAAGYNSFHELVLGGVPTLFVPNESPEMDDQGLRARYAQRRGLGLALRAAEAGSLDATLEALLDEQRAAAMRDAMSRLDQANGADEGAVMLAEMAMTGRADRA